MPRNVFLSFDADDLQLVNLVRAQAKNESSALQFADYSVKDPFNSYNARYIRDQIRPMIRGVSVVLCCIGYSTYRSEWVKWELDEAVGLGKGLVGLRLHSSSMDVPPSPLPYNGEVVDWNIPSLVTAIERAAHRAGY